MGVGLNLLPSGPGRPDVGGGGGGALLFLMCSHASYVLLRASAPSCAVAFADCLGVSKFLYRWAPAEGGGGLVVRAVGGFGCDAILKLVFAPQVDIRNSHCLTQHESMGPE